MGALKYVSSCMMQLPLKSAVSNLRGQTEDGEGKEEKIIKEN
jgi:hypothetical protein